MKKMISLLLVLSVLMTSCVFAYQTPQAESSAQQYLADKLFSRTFTIISNSGEDISDTFYQQFRSAYQAGDYESIYNFVATNVDYATHQVSQPYASAITEYSVQSDEIEVMIEEVVDVELGLYEENFGMEDHNALIYDVLLTYRRNTVTEEIVLANAPIVYSLELHKWYSNYEPVIESSNKRYAISSLKKYVIFSFDYEAGIYVYNDEYSAGNGLCYYYEGTIRITRFA